MQIRMTEWREGQRNRGRCLSSTDVEKLKCGEVEGGWKPRVVNTQTNCSVLQTRSINRYVKFSCKAIADSSERN